MGIAGCAVIGGLRRLGQETGPGPVITSVAGLDK